MSATLGCEIAVDAKNDPLAFPNPSLSQRFIVLAESLSTLSFILSQLYVLFERLVVRCMRCTGLKLSVSVTIRDQTFQQTCYAVDVKLTSDRRREIQLSKESVRDIARRMGISPTTVQKWRSRPTPFHARKIPDTLSPNQRAFLVLLRRAALLSLDDAWRYARVIVPAISRSMIYRVWCEVGLQSRPQPADVATWKGRDRRRGHYYVTVVPIDTGDEPLQLSVAADRQTGFIHARLERGDGRSLSQSLFTRLSYLAPVRTALYELAQQEIGSTLFAERKFINPAKAVPSAPWSAAQIAASDVVVNQFHLPHPDSPMLRDYQEQLAAYLDRMNGSVLGSLRGKAPRDFRL